MATEKTHAMRVLEARGVAYEVRTYDASGAFHSAEEAAALLGVAAASVYKTLVVLRESPRARPMLVMTPAEDDIDLRALAKAAGEKKLRMATQREAEQLTGMQAGGISAIALKRPTSFDIFMDARAASLDIIHISAGLRGMDLALAVEDLVGVTRARCIPLIE
jgi:Cys-tRNA(Pro)/Cys-tRNA(Cys) deacylase